MPEACNTGVVMDPIAAINPKKDSTLAMLLEAQRRDHRLWYLERDHLELVDGQAWGVAHSLTVRNDLADWFELGEPQRQRLGDLDVLLMRKDPPVDMEFFADTVVLERAAMAGTLVVNRPDTLRDAGEKTFTAWFPQCCPPTLMSRDHRSLREFVLEQGRAVVKPLNAMGGTSIFQVADDDPNLNVVIETVSRDGDQMIMAQAYIEAITEGDKRILMIDGEPVPYALARIPSAEDFRGNLAKGGRGEGVELSQRDLWICEQVGPELKKRGVLFAGLDVIGDYLTEINVTSPTCIRELDALYDLNIAGQLFDCIEERL